VFAKERYIIPGDFTDYWTINYSSRDIWLPLRLVLEFSVNDRSFLYNFFYNTNSHPSWDDLQSEYRNHAVADDISTLSILSETVQSLALTRLRSHVVLRMRLRLCRLGPLQAIWEMVKGYRSTVHKTPQPNGFVLQSYLRLTPGEWVPVMLQRFVIWTVTRIGV
jgi:hypothetical protein